MNKEFPTLKEIKKDYWELYDKIKNITKIEQLKEIDFTTTEVNGELDYLDLGITDNEVEWFRYENYGCLSYIYVIIKNKKIENIYFDVWSEYYCIDFIDNTTINTVEFEYNNAIKETQHMFKICESFMKDTVDN